MRGLLTRVAAGAPARVFVLEGSHQPPARDVLWTDERVQRVDSPRSANLLLVAGRLPTTLEEPAMRVHDAMSHPRRTIWWTRNDWAAAWPAPFVDATVVRASDDIVAALQRCQRELIEGRHPSEPALLPDADPAPWRGIGPYGQGGAGMTGGVPYGRPMAERAPDRDGLELDQVPVRVGPFFPPFPVGLVLDVALQGDVVQEATVGANPFATDGPAPPAGVRDVARSAAPLFRRALARPVAIAELERERARHHLHWIAHALRVQGLGALARRVVALAAAPGPAAARDLRDLEVLLERTRSLAWSTASVGVVDAAALRGRGLGPVARAAGLAEDERAHDEAYRAIGFEPIVHQSGDARARLRQRIAEARQSIDLVARAGERQAGGAGVVEAPRGRLTAHVRPGPALLSLVPSLLAGAEWGDAVTTVVSLDVDLREAAR